MDWLVIQSLAFLTLAGRMAVITSFLYRIVRDLLALRMDMLNELRAMRDHNGQRSGRGRRS